MATLACPCGWLGHRTRSCSCTPPAVQRYAARLSGPLLDRIDLQVELPGLDFAEWAGAGASEGETSATVRARVVAARERQTRRWGQREFALNAYASPRELRERCALDGPALAVLELAARRSGLSARALDRLLRVARTIADLAGEDAVLSQHVGEAMMYKNIDRNGAGAS